MRCLIVSNYFWPENFRINDLALNLVKRGHDVTVLTGIPNYPDGKFFSGYGFFRPKEEDYHGIRVVRTPIIPRGTGKALNLILNYLSQTVMLSLASFFLCRKEKFNIIFVFEPSPVTVGIPAIIGKKILSVPIIFWVLDIWPENLSATGFVKSPILLYLVRLLVRYIYSKCDQLLVSSQGFKKSIKLTGGYSKKIIYFPNWVEPEYLSTTPIDLANSLPILPNGFKVMFAGNIGTCQDFGTILLAAELLKDNRNIHWIILGKGRKESWVKERVKQQGLGKQFHLLGQFPPETMTTFFAQADAMLITLKSDSSFALTAPGKLQSYLSCGKPIVAAIDGEGARVINDAKAGYTCPAGKPKLLANLIVKLLNMSEADRRVLGNNGRTYCKMNYERKMLFDKLEAIMDNIAIKS